MVHLVHCSADQKLKSSRFPASGTIPTNAIRHGPILLRHATCTKIKRPVDTTSQYQLQTRPGEPMSKVVGESIFVQLFLTYYVSIFMFLLTSSFFVETQLVGPRRDPNIRGMQLRQAQLLSRRGSRQRRTYLEIPRDRLLQGSRNHLLEFRI